MKFYVGVIDYETKYKIFDFSVFCLPSELYQRCIDNYRLKDGQYFYCVSFTSGKVYIFDTVF